MPELLLELFSEEIPARMQGPAARDLERLVTGALADRGLLSQSVHAFVTPRRLGLVIEGLPARQPDMSEERKGPRVDGPPAAIEGFLKSTGLTRDQLTTKDDPKGAFYLARIERKGRPTTDVLAEVLPPIVTSFPWPKSMRWGTGELRWVRPLHRILCLFDGAVVPFEVGGITSGDETEGHRFLGRKTIRVRTFVDYRAELEHLNVMIDPKARRERILDDARAAAFAEGLHLVEDDALLEEVAGLVEWPVALIGRFEDEFLALPEEVLMTTMRTHQKYFSLRDAKTDRLASRFVTVSNMLTEDGGTRIIDGNARVIRARLSDARFFYEEDKKIPLAERVAGLEAMVFHARLGTVRAKVARMEALAADLAERLGTDVGAATEAAHLAKADLVTGMVGEFPELQGIMGGYYAAHGGKPLAVTDAIREHYSPLGPTDRVPSAPVSICVALADKLDTLTGFWAIDEKPTGSKDPYALRRAALGIIRIVLENDLRLDLETVAARASARHMVDGKPHAATEAQIADLMGFFADRLKVYLKDRGTRHDLIDAVFASGAQGDLWLVIERVKALAAFLSTDDGASLLALYRRAGNIVAKEEKKDKTSYAGAVEPARLVETPERAVHGLLAEVTAEAERAVADERFADAMAALARLRAPVDDFFEHVTVNADDAAVRRNRLHLLATIKAAIDQVADFSKIEG